MDNGYVELTNNTAERAVKPFVVQRKVFQTSGSYAGARYTTIIFSIIRTALINDIKIESYVEYLLKQLATNEPNDKLIEKLLPYSEEIKKQFKQPILTTRKWWLTLIIFLLSTAKEILWVENPQKRILTNFCYGLNFLKNGILRTFVMGRIPQKTEFYGNRANPRIRLPSKTA